MLLIIRERHRRVHHHRPLPKRRSRSVIVSRRLLHQASPTACRAAVFTLSPSVTPAPRTLRPLILALWRPLLTVLLRPHPRMALPRSRSLVPPTALQRSVPRRKLLVLPPLAFLLVRIRTASLSVPLLPIPRAPVLAFEIIRESGEVRKLRKGARKLTVDDMVFLSLFSLP